MDSKEQMLRDTATAFEERIIFLLTDDDFEAGIVPKLYADEDPFENPELQLTPSTKYSLAWPNVNHLIKPQLQVYLKNLQDLYNYILKGQSTSAEVVEYVLERKSQDTDGTDTVYCVYRLRDRTAPELGYRLLLPHNFW
uniref:Fibronectin type-III domain-containing protein n=1 Tax=Steinernema glaseri TaxID=37863 RepID=A0A1I8AHC8_9BILA